MLDPQVVVNLLSQLGYGVRHSHNNSLTMSGRLTFICVLEAKSCPELCPKRTTLAVAAFYPKVDRATVSLPQQSRLELWLRVSSGFRRSGRSGLPTPICDDR